MQIINFGSGCVLVLGLAVFVKQYKISQIMQNKYQKHCSLRGTFLSPKRISLAHLTHVSLTPNAVIPHKLTFRNF